MSKVIIIESGSRGRRLDPRQSSPRSLIPIETGQPSALHWSMRAFEEIGITDVTYVGGYHIEKVIHLFPNLAFRYLPEENRESELRALLYCDEPSENCLIIHATTVLMPAALSMMKFDGISVGIYYSEGVMKSVGMYVFDKVSIKLLFEIARSLSQNNNNLTIEDALRHLTTKNVIMDGVAAPANDKAAIAAMIFRGKAQTLENLAPLSKKAQVLAIERFTAAQWQNNPVAILERIQKRFATTNVVVRSSTVGEDNLNSSAAGQFLSILDVNIKDTAIIEQAIKDVINSYSDSGRDAHPGDEVLVQPHVCNLIASGVLLTRDPQYGTPYFVLTIDYESGRSDVVTSGGEGSIETQYVSWSSQNRTALEQQCEHIFEAGRELIELTHLDALDIEFGIDANGLCHLFQVRPLVCVESGGIDGDDDIFDVINHLGEFVKEASLPRPGVLGDDNLLSNMSDWNPAEMISSYPRTLALSLYQTLIGDHTWSLARTRLGYRDMTSQPLILSLAGRPYVDIRASLNSLLPADLDNNIGAKWVDHCMGKLRADPPLHDKIEFELTVTCLTPDWSKYNKWLIEAGLDAEERDQFQQSLLDLTLAIVKGQVEPPEQQFTSIKRLTERREEVMAASSVNLAGLGRQLRQLLLDCMNLGLVPFSIVARQAFIALSILKGLRAIGAIDANIYDSFLQAIPTVSREFAVDTERLMSRDISMVDMVALYGHLRPNSYDITSSNYASRPDHYFRSTGGSIANENQVSLCPIEVLLTRKDIIDEALANVGLDVDTKTLAQFMADSISGREKIKFEFMKSVDAILETISKIGVCLNVDNELLSFVPVAEFISLESNSSSRVLESYLRRISSHNEKHWLLAKTLRLPDLISSADDMLAHRLDSWRPNFVTRKRVKAKPVLINDDTPPEAIDDAIVFIRAADPGFDWIFGHPVAGLVTQYGGVASHMAIRAAEFGLPAAIGCGEVLFDRLSHAKLVELDCEHHSVKVI